jgi:hypothetical protein
MSPADIRPDILGHKKLSTFLYKMDIYFGHTRDQLGISQLYSHDIQFLGGYFCDNSSTITTSGFTDSEVLFGSPFGGSTNIWQHDSVLNRKSKALNSCRIVAATHVLSTLKLCFVNVYTPCDAVDFNNSAEFLHKLLLCEIYFKSILISKSSLETILILIFTKFD